MGTGRRLKAFNPEIQLISLQPDCEDHNLEGWKHLPTAKMPSIYDDSLADDTMLVNTEEAYKMIANISLHEGLLVSPSSAANLVGAIKLAETLDYGTVVTVFTDNASKYSAVIDEVATNYL